MTRLNSEQIKTRLKRVREWSKRSRAIRRVFQFAGFLKSVEFVNRVAKLAEKADHHPDIDIRWNKVTLTLTTHSAGGLTGKDFLMAQECDRVARRFFKV